jgi:L,D-peptidoglycan transpeptidase YkuD (ErfK/YbiS/YcfS/YnhG family)
MLRLDLSTQTLVAFGRAIPAAIGRSGAVASATKREGDGATPVGTWPLLTLLLRPDRLEAPDTALPWRWLRPEDGWSDDPADPAYNQPASHPHGFSAERLWRDDHAYDIIVMLGHNRNPVVPGAGSAIFWHVAQPDYRPTEGCIAIARDAFVELLPLLVPGMLLTVAPAGDNLDFAPPAPH